MARSVCCSVKTKIKLGRIFSFSSGFSNDTILKLWGLSQLSLPPAHIAGFTCYQYLHHLYRHPYKSCSLASNGYVLSWNMVCLVVQHNHCRVVRYMLWYQGFLCHSFSETIQWEQSAFTRVQEVLLPGILLSGRNYFPADSYRV